MGRGGASGIGACAVRHGGGLHGAPTGERATGDEGKSSKSRGALASHAARTRFGGTVGPGLDGRGSTAVRSAQVRTPLQHVSPR